MTTRAILDLTRPLDASTPIYAEGGYSDPPLTVEPWCSVSDQGFRVSKLSLGTQTGTHIDAPAHFVEGGATLETCPAADLIGRYTLIDTARLVDAANRRQALACHTDERILFLSGDGDVARVPSMAIDDLLALACPVWVTALGIEIDGAPPLAFHHALARNGVFLVEDLDPVAARLVRPGGEIAALPLRLTGTSGAPCRVVVIQDEIGAG